MDHLLCTEEGWERRCHRLTLVVDGSYSTDDRHSSTRPERPDGIRPCGDRCAGDDSVLTGCTGCRNQAICLAACTCLDERGGRAEGHRSGDVWMDIRAAGLCNAGRSSVAHDALPRTWPHTGPSRSLQL